MGEVTFGNLDLDPLWRWMNARQEIWNRRFRQKKKFPWTNDPILREYKFTNVYRELDRVTLELHKRLDSYSPSALKLYHIIAFRAFNRPETYDELHAAEALYSYGAMIKTLRRMSKARKKIFTGAYIVTNAGSQTPKIELMARALEKMYKERNALFAAIKADGTMQGATSKIAAFDMQGNFTSYEVVCDLRWQTGMGLDHAPDRMTWANLGPGARRGINRLVAGKGPYPNVYSRKEHYVEFMRHALMLAPESLDKSIFRHAARLEMREIEHSLCELDKYIRAESGEGRPRSKYRCAE